MSKEYPILCPSCETSWRRQGKLDNMVKNCTNSNPCDVCRSSSQCCTQFMDVVERAEFDRKSEEKSREMREKENK